METKGAYPLEKFIKKAIVVEESSFIEKSNLILPKAYFPYVDKVVLSKGMILDRIEKLAQEITKDYFNKKVVSCSLVFDMIQNVKTNCSSFYKHELMK